MKIWVLLCAFLACVLLASAGRHSSSHSSESSESSEDSSESHSHSHRRGNNFRSAKCILRSAPSSNVAGDLFLYQRRNGDTVWIKGSLRGLGPRGTDYALTFHRGYPSPGECDRAGDILEGVGGDFASVNAYGDNSGAGVNTGRANIRLEEGFDNSVIGRSIVVRRVSDGTRVACCAIDRSGERYNY